MGFTDEHLHYPMAAVPYLEWYRSHFSDVFVAFHPFFELPGITPADCDWGTVIIDNRGVPASAKMSLDMADDYATQERAGLIATDDIRSLIPTRARPLSWAHICRETGLDGPRQLNQALLTHIRSLRPEYESRARAAAVTNLCDKRSIFLPTEGAFQVLHRSWLSLLFRQAGATRVFAGDDNTEEVRPWPVEDVGKPWQWWPKRLWSPEQTILAVVDWDSFFTLICLSDSVARTIEMPPFEGFWSDATTGHDWWLSSLPGNA